MGVRSVTRLGKTLGIFGGVVAVFVCGMGLDVCCNSSEAVFHEWFGSFGNGGVYVCFGRQFELTAKWGGITVIVVSGSVEDWMVGSLLVWDSLVCLWRLLVGVEVDYRVVDMWRRKTGFVFNRQFTLVHYVKNFGWELDFVSEWMVRCGGKFGLFWGLVSEQLGLDSRQLVGLEGLVGFLRLVFGLLSCVLGVSFEGLVDFNKVSLELFYGKCLLLLSSLDLFARLRSLLESGLWWLLVDGSVFGGLEKHVGDLDVVAFGEVKKELEVRLAFWRVVWREGRLVRYYLGKIRGLLESGGGGRGGVEGMHDRVLELLRYLGYL